jgi:hypothetical protein
MTYLKELNCVRFDSGLTHCQLKEKLYQHLSKLIDRLGIAADYNDKTYFNSLIADQFLTLGILSDIDRAQATRSQRLIVIEQQRKIFDAIGITITH